MTEPRARPDWLIVDGLAPFFREVNAPRINWSKIPFAELEADGQPDVGLLGRIEEDFRRFCEQAARFGFNAITLDDLAHLVDDPAHPDGLRRKIAVYQETFGRCFEIAREHGLRVLITTDIMYYRAGEEPSRWGRLEQALASLERSLEQLFQRFPAVAGIVTRIGETDGLDVRGDFRSHLVIRTPGQARRLLDRLLPVVERHTRWWIFRTWSVGAYRIGDLIWNRNTFAATFKRVRSPRLILSMKYGETDFFRYLPLNRHFFRCHLPCLVELQARREYEGAGEYPAFIGADYERYRNQLREAPHWAGAMIWCQTGGWTRFRRLTFGATSSLWNEINTWVAVRLVRDGVTAAEAVESWRVANAPQLDGARLLRLLRLSEEVMSELLYIDDFAQQKLFFRRLRVPPLLSVFWDRIVINHAMRQFLRCFVREGESKVLQGQRALEKIAEMKALATGMGLPATDFDFMYDSFALLSLAREYYFREFSPDLVERLTRARAEYRARHAVRYSVHLDFRPVPLTRARLRRYLRVLLRRQRGYRLFDHIFTLRLLGWLYPLLRRGPQKLLPDFSRQQAMGVDTLFK